MIEPLGPNLQQVGGVWSGLTNLNFLHFDQPKENVKDQGNCEMHMPLVVWNL